MWRLILILIFVSTLTLTFIACIPEINITDNDSDGSNNDDPPFNDDDGTDDDDDDGDDDDDDDDNGDDDDDDDDNVYENLLFESFESETFPPEGWEVKNTNPAPILNWTRDSYCHYEGAYSARVYSYIALANELLYSKNVELVGYDSYEVTFWNFGAYSIYGGDFDPSILSLEVSYDGANWTKIWNFNSNDWIDLSLYSGGWDEIAYHEERINLDAYSGDTIRLGWRQKYSYNGSLSVFLWTTDDINVWGITNK